MRFSYVGGTAAIRRTRSGTHDHCFFCWAKFSVKDGPETLDEGYSTEDEYRWICSTCFEDFKDRFHWTVRAPG